MKNGEYPYQTVGLPETAVHTETGTCEDQTGKRRSTFSYTEARKNGSDEGTSLRFPLVKECANAHV
jgi:hypothetical protein